MDILITGTSDGIGRATAEYFLERGHSVVGFDRKPLPSHIPIIAMRFWISAMRMPIRRMCSRKFSSTMRAFRTAEGISKST